MDNRAIDHILDLLGQKDDGIPTATWEAQREVEESVLLLYLKHKYGPSWINRPNPPLLRDLHIKFLRSGLNGLKKGFVSLDASKPWLIYWIIHSLDLLKDPLSASRTRQVPPIADFNLLCRIADTVSRCQHPEGGFAGGPGQSPHLATTYAAVNALAIVGTEKAYQCINRPAMLKWLLSLKLPDGSFQMNRGGEVDVRGSYCAISVAKMLNLLTPQLTDGVAAYIAKCQTYEGGIGCFPGVEAHGGYTFCGLAAMALLGQTDLLDIPLLTNWVAMRQMSLEGGYQGRTNKLVDGCYSFWQGACGPILEALHRKDPYANDAGDVMGNREALREYILICCQNTEVGGLLDKPEKSPDFYHSCYCLSGISIIQSEYVFSGGTNDDIAVLEALVSTDHLSDSRASENTDALKIIHPLHNVALEHAEK
ncbi:terpenoid cyclases/protein prenyltransferase alpha-alpha toroid [Chytridium lagenaria]|nr:terpenoid cyclases/protein prenyltransferase alpha-alpha toroid [Chytridium lagenaria]